MGPTTPSDLPTSSLLTSRAFYLSTPKSSKSNQRKQYISLTSQLEYSFSEISTTASHISPISIMAETPSALALFAYFASLTIAPPLQISAYSIKQTQPTAHSSFQKGNFNRDEVSEVEAAQISGYDADTESDDESHDNPETDCDSSEYPPSRFWNTMETSLGSAFSATNTNSVSVFEATIAAAARPRLIRVGRATTPGSSR